MTLSVLDMTDKQKIKFEDNLTFDQLIKLSDEEVDDLDNEIVTDVIKEFDFFDVEDRIHYYDKFKIDYDDDEIDFYHSWLDKVDRDIGAHY